MKTSRLSATLLVGILLCFMVTSSGLAQLTTDWEYAFNENFTPKSSANSLDLTSDHRLTVVGYEYSGYFDYRFLAFKLDLDGNYVSHVNHSSISIGSHVEEDSNGNFILLTNPNSDTGFVRYLDPDYELKWLKEFDGYIGEVHGTSNNYLIVPVAPLYDDPQLYLLTRQGTEVWSVTVEIPGNNGNTDVVETSDGGFVFATNEFGGILYLVKIDSNGQLVWINQHNFNDTYITGSVNYMVDGGFLISGYIQDNSTNIGIVKFDSDGDYIFMGEGVYGESVEMGDGSIMNVDYREQEACTILRYDASGHLLAEYEYEFNNPPVFEQRIADVEITGDSSFAVCGRCGNELFNRMSAFVTHFTLPPTDVEINIEAYRQPLFIRQQGVFYWYGEVRNNTASPMTRDVWVQARKPDGSLSGALALWSDLEIPANGEITATVRQGVPLDAPLGEYNYIVRIGDYPNPQFQHHFALTVVDGQPSGPDVNTDLSPPDFVPDRPLKPSDFSLDISPDTWNGEPVAARHDLSAEK
ncbi:hypothetical protein KQI52_05915 [bacterium]|nr:hypothetical protein [bacterium]